MRSILALLLLAAPMSAPAGAQSVIPPLDVSQASGPNARAAQRPLGPNAQIAGRVTGPNAALARADKTRSPVHYPSCSAAGAARPTPIRRGEPGYARNLDRDGNGIACE